MKALYKSHAFRPCGGVVQAKPWTARDAALLPVRAIDAENVTAPGFIAATFGVLNTVSKWDTFCVEAEQRPGVMIAVAPSPLIYQA
jgi:hypothetical protein